MSRGRRRKKTSNDRSLDEGGIPAITFRRNSRRDVKKSLRASLPQIEEESKPFDLLCDCFFNNQTESFQVSKLPTRTRFQLEEIAPELLVDMLTEFQSRSPARERLSRLKRFEHIVLETWRKHVIQAYVNDSHLDRTECVKETYVYDPENKVLGLGRIIKKRPGSRVIVQWSDGSNDQFRRDRLNVLELPFVVQKACDTVLSKGSPISFQPTINHYELLMGLECKRVWETLIHFSNLMEKNDPFSNPGSLFSSLLHSAKQIQDVCKQMELQCPEHSVPKAVEPSVERQKDLTNCVILGFFENLWLPARVTKQFSDNSVEAVFLGWVETHTLQPEEIKELNPPAEPSFREGDRVYGQYDEEWHEAIVVDVLDKYTYKIQYADFPDEVMEACFTQLKAKPKPQKHVRPKQRRSRRKQQRISSHSSSRSRQRASRTRTATGSSESPPVIRKEKYQEPKSESEHFREFVDERGRRRRYEPEPERRRRHDGPDNSGFDERPFRDSERRWNRREFKTARGAPNRERSEESGHHSSRGYPKRQDEEHERTNRKHKISRRQDEEHERSKRKHKSSRDGRQRSERSNIQKGDPARSQKVETQQHEHDTRHENKESETKNVNKNHNLQQTVSTPSTAETSSNNQELLDRIAKLESVLQMTQQQTAMASPYPYINPPNGVPLIAPPPGPWQPQMYDSTMSPYPIGPIQVNPLVFPASQVLMPQQASLPSTPVHENMPMPNNMQPQVQAQTVMAGSSNPPAQKSEDLHQQPVKQSDQYVDWTKEEGIPLDFNNSMPLPDLPKEKLPEKQPKRLNRRSGRGRGKPRSRRG